MIIDKNISLKNSFGINASSNICLTLESEKCIDELTYFLNNKSYKKLIIGEATNILLPENFEGVIIKNNILNISIISKDEVIVGGGVNWDYFVNWSLENNFYGLENLTLIPGSVGAAPIQNIGAYGVEISKFIKKVRFYDFIDKQIKEFTQNDCNFSYRKSIFQDMDILILSVYFKFVPGDLVTSYDSINDYLNTNNIKASDLTPIKLSNIIKKIRLDRLPDYTKIPNVGSFFKNPILNKADLNLEKLDIKKLITWDLGNGMIKIGAARLIELVKDKIPKDVNVDLYKNHALVLINKNNATQDDVIQYSSFIQKEVFNTFDINLEIEPIIIDS
tara:strand:+ start:763 stop:1761 length:999 start_codon:yes stop_codon:yes gene_type:complete